MGGIQSNIILRVVSENFDFSKHSYLACPEKKGLKVSLENILITDVLIPPMQKTQFRLEAKVFSKVEGFQKFRKVYDLEIFFRVKE